MKLFILSIMIVISSNLYSQCQGDMNNDGIINVIDIVSQVNFILADNDGMCEDCIDLDNDNICDDEDDCLGFFGVCESCDDNGVSPEGFYCGDLLVLQNIIDLNPSLNNVQPTDLGVQTWSNENNRILGIDLSNLGIISLPININQLTELNFLNLSDNQIVQLPSSISNLMNLDVLYLDNNWTLQQLPYNLCNLPNDCVINITNHYLCEEFHFDCISAWFGNQSNCCEGFNSFGQLIDNWSVCGENSENCENYLNILECNANVDCEWDVEDNECDEYEVDCEDYLNILECNANEDCEWDYEENECDD